MYQAAKIDLDLSELDEVFSGFKVVIKNPRLLPWKMTKELMHMGDETEERIKGIENMVKAVIVHWNIEDPDTGEVFQLPKHDPDVLDKIPSEIAQYLMTKVGESFTQAAKKTKTSSAASTTP